MEISKEVSALTYKIIGVCMEVHRVLGPGFPEQYYQRSLEFEFGEQRIVAEPQKGIPLLYKNVQVGMSFLDFEIEHQLILEIKSVNQLTDVHLFQVLKYLSVTNLDVALLVNFGREKLEYRRILPTHKWQEFKRDSQQIKG